MLLGSVILLLSILFYFRYLPLLSQSVFSLLQPGGDGVSVGTLVPLGISFYMLQAIAYLIDIYNGKLKPSANFVHVALYLSFIFKLVAGPIERPQGFLQQIQNKRSVTSEQINTGFFLIILGLLEKRVMADNLAPIVNNVFSDPIGNAGVNIALGTLAFAFQLYGDFSGYSNIFRGLAKFLGYELTINFKLPYLAGSPTEFWQRWHISLSNWLREYIFFPVRRFLVQRKVTGSLSVVLPTALAMLGSGLWHGATPNFILWGLYFALLSVLYYYFDKSASWRKTKISSLVIAVLRIGFMFVLVNVGWMIFRSESLPNLANLFTHLSLQANLQTHGYFSDLIFFAVPVLAVNLVQVYTGDLLALAKWPVALRAAAYVFILSWVFVFGAGVSVEFIYGRF